MVNVHGNGRCAITLDPKTANPASSPTRVWCRCGDQREKLEKFSDVLQHYMLQSEQLDTTLGAGRRRQGGRRAADPAPAHAGQGNLAGQTSSTEDEIGQSEDYNRIATAGSQPEA
jgi:molecular chaperone Hsp33